MKRNQLHLLAGLVFAFCIILSDKLVQSQVNWDSSQEVDDVMGLVSNYTYPALHGRCYKCVFESNVSVYMRQAPVCLFEWEDQLYNIAEDVERFTCFNDDPRAYEDMECKTPVSNDTFDCLVGCFGTPEVEEGETYTLNADRRCTYKINFWNKTAVSGEVKEKRQLLFEYIGQEMPVFKDDGRIEQSSLVPYSPYKDEVFYWVTPARLENFAGAASVDRNNVMGLRSPRFEHIFLEDSYYLMIINMSEGPMRFTISGASKPAPGEETDPNDSGEKNESGEGESTADDAAGDNDTKNQDQDNDGQTNNDTDNTDQGGSSKDDKTTTDTQEDQGKDNTDDADNADNADNTDNADNADNTDDTNNTDTNVDTNGENDGDNDGDTTGDDSQTTEDKDKEKDTGDNQGKIDDKDTDSSGDPVIDDGEQPSDASDKDQTTDGGQVTDEEAKKMTHAEILELYAGSSSVKKLTGQKAEAADTSTESQAVLMTVAALTGFVIVITIYYNIAVRCRQAKKIKDDDLDAEISEPNSGNRVMHLSQSQL